MAIRSMQRRCMVKLFAQDAIFLGTMSRKLALKTEEIDAFSGQQN
jgi:hypothetical protein